MPLPHTEDSAFWESAFELYHLDLVREAAELIAEHGLGDGASQLRWYRLIEAEALLRERSEIYRDGEPLSLETVPAETFRGEKRLHSMASEAMSDLRAQFQCEPPMNIRIGILCRESEAPWATNPNGYWIHKDPYDKICLPFCLLEDEVEFRRAVLHEYAHVITGHLSDDQAPTWLHEAVSMWAETSGAPEDLAFDEVARWLEPTALERLLESEAIEDTDTVFQGYLQCQWIGRYLERLGGGEKLRLLLVELGDQEVKKNLIRLIHPAGRVDHSLRTVYGISMKELFGGAKRLMQNELNAGRTSDLD